MKCPFTKNSAHIHHKGFMYPCTVSDLDYGKMGKVCNDKFEDVFKHKLNVSNEMCYRCIENERDGNVSFSRWKNDETEEFYFLDIRLDNNCNFKCISCNGKNSISFKTEDDTTHYTSLYKHLVKNIDFIKKFKRVYIGGGEPFLATEILSFLKMLNSEQEILISSNISVLKMDVIEELKRFKDVIFYPSIDHINEKGAYIRFGFNQSTFDKNFDFLNSTFKCVPVVTVSALNVHNLDNIINHLSNFTNRDNIYLNILDFPKSMHVSVLPKILKAKAVSALNSIIESSNSDFIIDAPYNIYKGARLLLKKINPDNTMLFDELINSLKEKDELRNNSYKILYDGII